MRRLLLVLLVMAGCSSGTGGREVTEAGSVTATGAAGAQRATIGMDDSRRFVPNTVRARTGTVTLSIENRGHLAHNLVFDDRDLGRTQMIDGKASATLTVKVAEPGTYTFVCTPHPGMEGQLVVGR